MKEININVRVQIGVTDALCSLLSAFAKGTTPAAEIPEQTAPAQKPASVEAPAAEVEKPAQTEVKPEPEQAPAPAEEPKTEETELTEVDVRAAMDKTRRRIEGEDYKENTTGEGYKKYHRQLTGQFKNIAAFLGADKPSALPADKRASFISQCDELYINEAGEIDTKVPF